MRLVPWVVVAGAFGLLLEPAMGFQETTVGGGEKPAQSKAAPAEPKATPTPGGATLNLDIPDVSKSTGTEVRIPGLGTVGVLPKLDFGLELLYGAAEQKAVTPDDRTHPDPNDLQIRGTIKHRF